MADGTALRQIAQKRRFVMARGDGMAGLSGMPELPLRRRKSGRPHNLPGFLLFIRKRSTNTGYIRS